MFRQIKYIAILAAALFGGCQKLDLDPQVDGTPVFSANITLNGVTKEWQAGVGGYYLFTSFEKGADEVYVFKGQLKKDSCSTGACGESLTVKIRDVQLTLNGLPDVVQALAPGNYPYQLPAAADTLWVVGFDHGVHEALDLFLHSRGDAIYFERFLAQNFVWD